MLFRSIVFVLMKYLLLQGYCQSTHCSSCSASCLPYFHSMPSWKMSIIRLRTAWRILGSVVMRKYVQAKVFSENKGPFIFLLVACLNIAIWQKCTWVSYSFQYILEYPSVAEYWGQPDTFTSLCSCMC